MTAGAPELIVGGVLLSPFIRQAAIAFAILLVCRPGLRRLRIERFVAEPPLVTVCLFIIILAAITLADH